ncbi:DNA gyrase subunit A [Candidatus Deianiraea vastatrix]|uniref:DNA gyrase subunit A n=1 Tax=Candidatus Deianiraea vastatrix TaxID=2163644 RepID=A0A5B8XF64_9RICK|nr:DNA gyrase subunit A [Candidatus Deianiraea vastatrix]QED23064.1 DNA gyrase subunit A [Candidatus Deianiraea vastatrix]
MSIENNTLDQEKGVVNVSIEKEMQTSYLEYAMSVIVSRAIPDVRDGLKPVHRRILYAMDKMDCAYNKPHKKSARVVGEVMGKYHPHGDSAIYEAMVRMAQDFSMRETLVHGQGNFGSIDDDPPASMRYTEARLTKLATSMLADLDNNTVDFKDNYDGFEKEPVVLPASFPNILVNGTEGIAVGMATNIPPHNLGEVIDGCLAYLQNNAITDDEILQIIPGPDFPTGATIIGRKGSMQAICTGRGSVLMRGTTNIEEMKGGRESIVITSIPYQVVKTRLIEKIVELIKDKRIEGISDIRDETNKKGIRVVIELKKDAHADVILNHLYKYTPLQTSFSYNTLLLNHMKPELMNVRSIIKAFINFREEIVIRRITHLLAVARNKAHVLIGLCVAVDNIDEVIKIIRSSADTAEARSRLGEKPWPAKGNIEKLIALVHDKSNTVKDGLFFFTEGQIKAILEMRLSKLVGLEKEKLVSELEDLGREIEKFLHILGSKEEIIKIIADELAKIKEEFATPRKTEILIDEAEDVDMEAFIPREDMLITMTINGFIKRNPLSEYTSQRRGGKGKKGMETNEDDVISDVLISNTHQHILFFSNFGKVYRMKAYQLPLGGNNKKGRAIVNILPLQNGEKINTLIPVPENKEEREGASLIFATKKGNIRRSGMADFENINSGGKIAIKLDEDDALVGVSLANDKQHAMLCSKEGSAIRFAIDDLRVIKSRTSDGVRGMNVEKGDEVVSMCILSGHERDITVRDEYLSIPYQSRIKMKTGTQIDIETELAILKKDGKEINLDSKTICEMSNEEEFLLAITENGYGKRTSAFEYRITNRGGKGVININTSARNGGVVSTFVVNEDDDVMLIAKSGKIIRCKANGISVFSRSAQGVKIIDVAKDDKIVSVAKVTGGDDSEEEMIEISPAQ